VECGELQLNHNLLREIKALALRLPLVLHGEDKDFDSKFYDQMADGTLLAYLGIILQSCNNLNKFVRTLRNERTLQRQNFCRPRGRIRMKF